MCCCSACTIMIMNIVYIIVFKDGKTNLSESRGSQKNLLEQMIKDSFFQQDLHLALKINRLEHLLTVRVVWLECVKQSCQFLHPRFQDKPGCFIQEDGMLMDAKFLLRQQHHTFRHPQNLILHYVVCIHPFLTTSPMCLPIVSFANTIGNWK